MPDRSNLKIEVLSGAWKGRQFQIEKLDFTLGRNEENEISLAGDTLVSGKHIRFFKRSDGWHLEDLNSTNGTISEGRKIFQSRIAVGQVIELGFGGPRIKLTPYSMEEAKAIGFKGTEYIAAVVAKSIQSKTKIYPYLLVGILFLIIVGFVRVYWLEDEIAIVKSHIQKHNQEISFLRKDISGISNELSSLKSNQDDAIKKLMRFQNRFEELALEVARNKEEINSINNKLNALPQKIFNFQKMVEDFTSTVIQLNTAVSKRENEVFFNSESEVQELSKLVLTKFENLESEARELGIDLDYLQEAMERANEPKLEATGLPIIDLFRTVHSTIRKTSGPLKTSFTVLKSLVDNEVILALAPIARRATISGSFGFLL